MSDRDKPFLSPILKGKRFKAHGIPLEVLKEFENYRRLLLAVARELYFEENPHRKSVPPRFNSSFQLELNGLEEGSAIAHLARYRETGPSQGRLDLEGMSTAATGDDIYTRARDALGGMLIEVAANDQIPETFPQSAGIHKAFNKWGETLKPGESIQLNTHLSQGIPLTKTMHGKVLDLFESRDGHQETRDITGVVVGIDQSREGRRTFTFSPRNFSKAKVMGAVDDLSHDQEKALHLALLQAKNTGLMVNADIEFDASGVPRRFVKVHDLKTLELEPNLEARLNVLALLKDGWLDGAGKQPQRDALNRARSLGRHLAVALRLPWPYAFPTPEGGIELEWEMPIVIEIDPDGRKGLAARVSDALGDDAQEFRLTDEDEVVRLVAYFKEAIEAE